MKPTRVVAVVAAAALALWASVAVSSSEWVRGDTIYSRSAAWMVVVIAWVLPACGTVLWGWRPANREGPALLVLGAAWATWAAMGASGGLMGAWSGYVAAVFRPLLFWIVLAWPTGRISRGDARWLSVWAVLQLAVPAGTSLLFMPTLGSTSFANPLMIADLVSVANAARGLYASIVLPMGAVLLVGSTLRRYRRLPRTARSLMAPAVVAAWLVALGDLNLVASDYVRDHLQDNHGTALLGGIVLYLDYLRFGAVPLLLILAAARTRRFAATSQRLRTLDLGERDTDLRLQAAVTAALGDPTARVAFARTGRTFVDQSGAEVELGGEDRTVTRIERNGSAIAAIEHAASLDDRPAVVELSVAAAGVSIEFERLEAVANARRAEALQVRRAIVDVQDRARERLERDLHDGAQQRLVGLALQASLGARDGDADVVAADLARGITEARRDLHEVAAGLLPSLLADRGLAASLTALAATAPMAVDIEVRQPEHLPPAVLVGAWFVVAEAVANAAKHSGATHVTVTGGIDTDALDMVIVDNGRGGAQLHAGGGLDGLRDRVARSGGLLTVESPPGAGTRVRARFPLERVP